jgi:glycosyltransferase involved in cell wall biosynthesis
MIPLSIIIVAKNEAAAIGTCLDSIQNLTDDIRVVDTGSEDNTMAIAASKGATVQQLEWRGYGNTKNEANLHAKYDWILQMDADESIDNTLKNELLKIDFTNRDQAYIVERKRYFMGKIMRFGAWGGEKRIRLFPKLKASWSDDLVHEKLLLKNLKVVRLQGNIFDNTFKDFTQFSKKMETYADLCARKYLLKKVKGAGWKRYLSPTYTFLWNYMIRLGFLDGKAGFLHAWTIAKYTYRKYSILYQLIHDD